MEKQLEITAADGIADGYLFQGGSERPGVLFYTDIGGIRDSNLKMAKRVADAGYIVLVPNLFYRTSRVPVFHFPLVLGEERTTKRFGELGAPLVPEAMGRDADAYVDYLASLPGVSQGPMGVVGFCFSGAMALRTAACRPDQIGAAASFHGAGLYKDDPKSPHHVLPEVRAKLYIAHADQDRGMPRDAIERFDQALEDWGGEYESELYEGALHGWTVPDHPAYKEPEAERAFGKLMDLFRSTL